jgi:hypothetical protein
MLISGSMRSVTRLLYLTAASYFVCPHINNHGMCTDCTAGLGVPLGPRSFVPFHPHTRCTPRSAQLQLASSAASQYYTSGDTRTPFSPTRHACAGMHSIEQQQKTLVYSVLWQPGRLLTSNSEVSNLILESASTAQTCA